jgi:hypothetical protein
MDTGHIEQAITAALAGGPLTLDQLDPHLPYVDDRRWHGVAMMHLETAGKVRYVNADGPRDGSTVVELT